MADAAPRDRGPRGDQEAARAGARPRSGRARSLLSRCGSNLRGYETVWRVVPGLRRHPSPGAVHADGVSRARGARRVRVRASNSLLHAVFACRRRSRCCRAGRRDRARPPVPVFGAVAADTPNAASPGDPRRWSAARAARVRADLHYGSVYLGYARQSPRERPQGSDARASRRRPATARTLRVPLLRPRLGSLRPRRALRRGPSRPLRPEPVLRAGLCRQETEAMLARKAGGHSPATGRSRRTSGRGLM